MKQDDAAEWRQAAVNEPAVHQTNGIWTLVDQPKDRLVIGSKWVFTKKYCADGSFEHYKGCLVVQGFSQCSEFEYLEVFTLTVHLPTLCIILALAAIHVFDLSMSQMLI